MKNHPNQFSRRSVIKGSLLGACLPLIPSSLYSMGNPAVLDNSKSPILGDPPPHFPNIDPEIVSEIVGKSHFNLERVKELVDPRPELARATWEWRFGDWESAIGAASHVGRRDIAEYLMEKGARPTIFTFAMFGAYEIVKSLIEFFPGIQQTQGPHGFSLLFHANVGLRMKDKMTVKEQDRQKQLIDYLEALGDADGETYEEMTPEAQKKYLGDYKYGDAEEAGFTVKLNMRKMLSLAPIGGFGGAMYKIGDNLFTYNGAPSVTISFEMEKEEVKFLTVTEPEFSITAKKVS